MTVSAFAICRTTVTQALYTAVMGQNPSRSQGPDFPVESVSWFDAVLFCNALSTLKGLPEAYVISGETVTWLPTLQGYRLPTEAEWEYACRAGTTTRWSHGDDEASLDNYAWFGERSDDKAHPVAQKKPNPWGLYDMHGNVWEWCHDAYTDDFPAPLQTPTDPSPGRVRRGGSFWLDADACQSSYRSWESPDFCSHALGFRLAAPIL